MNPFKTITQSDGVICIGFSCSVRNSPLTFSPFFSQHHKHHKLFFLHPCITFSLLYSPPPFTFFPLPRVLLLNGRKLQFSKLPAEVPVMFRVVELPEKQHICKVKSLNKGDANSEVTVYYQVGLQLEHAAPSGCDML